jgi:cytochrome P450
MTSESAARADFPARPLPRIGLATLVYRALSARRSGNDERIDMLSGLTKQYDELGSVVLQDLRVVKMINMFGPAANKYVLLDRDKIFSARTPWMRIMGRIFPNGLLLQDGAVHKQHRRIMHMPFKRPALRIYSEQMNEKIASGLDVWASAVGPEPWLAFPAFKTLTLDMAASIFLGCEAGPSATRMNQAFEDMVAASMSRIRLPIPGLEFQRGLAGRAWMQRFVGDLLPERRAGDGQDMLTRLCQAETEEGDRFTDAEILDHMIFLMMAAHDTTTSTLTSMTYELAKHPEWQERLREESRAHPEPNVGLDDRFEGLGWVLDETLRRYPPLPTIPRVATEAFGFDGVEIPANAIVVAPIHTHYMHEWWDQPQRFDPLRFSPERAEHERHTHSWVPFGGGAHTCLGRRFAELQVMAVMHQMLLRFRWSVPESYVMPVQQAPISKPRDGLPIQLERIDESAGS